MKKSRGVVLIDSQKNKLQSQLGVAKGQVWGGFLHSQSHHTTQNPNSPRLVNGFF